MKKNNWIFLLLPLILFFSSCFWEKKEDKILCSFKEHYIRPIGVVFIGYQPNEIDSFIVFKYQAGSMDSAHFIEQVTFVSDLENIKSLGGDTLCPVKGNVNKEALFILQSKIDQIVYLPKTNDTFLITGTYETTAENPQYVNRDECPKGEFIHPMKGTKINGDSVEVDIRWTWNIVPYSFVYLRK